MDLKKLAESTKANSMMYESLAQRMFDMLPSLDDTNNDTFIIAVTALSATGLTLILFMWLFYKYRILVA